MKKSWANYLALLFMSFLFIVGCGESGIQNIRQAENASKADFKQPIRVMTFNIRVGAGRENPTASLDKLHSSNEDKEIIIAAINSANPDLVALQEVKGSYQAKFFAKKLNMNYVYISHGQANFPFFGLAILSKYSIIKVNKKTIAGGRYPKKGLICNIDVKGKEIAFIDVHYDVLEYPFEKQVENTMEIIKTIEPPVILAGDFNMSDAEKEMIAVRKKLVDTCLAAKTESSKFALKYPLV